MEKRYLTIVGSGLVTGSTGSGENPRGDRVTEAIADWLEEARGAGLSPRTSVERGLQLFWERQGIDEGIGSIGRRVDDLMSEVRAGDPSVSDRAAVLAAAVAYATYVPAKISAKYGRVTLTFSDGVRLTLSERLTLRTEGGDRTLREAYRSIFSKLKAMETQELAFQLDLVLIGGQREQAHWTVPTRPGGRSDDLATMWRSALKEASGGPPLPIRRGRED